MAKINELLHRELANLIFLEFEDPALSISAVETAADLKTAKVYVRLFGKSLEEADWTLAQLQAKAFQLTKLLFERLTVKTVPELHFIVDHSPDQVVQVETLLDQLHHPDHTL